MLNLKCDNEVPHWLSLDKEKSICIYFGGSIDSLPKVFGQNVAFSLFLWFVNYSMFESAFGGIRIDFNPPKN